MNTYNIIDSGAVASPEIKNTPAIQKAIDTCWKHGGGSVLVPAGEFVTGTIYLRDNVNLVLSSGAVLKGSPDLADYNADDNFPQNEVFKAENVTGAHLIIALEVKNVSITGLGRIDGNGSSFFGPETVTGKFVIKTPRPGQRVYIVECENVVVEGVELVNTPYWTLCFHGCENVRVRSLKITNPRETHNGDGIDIDTCRNVTVSDCVISTFGNGIRVGVGNGIIRNCTISNLVIQEARCGLCFVAKYSWDVKERGVDIENITVSNVVMNATMPFHICTGDHSRGIIKNLAFNNIRATGRKCSWIVGIPGNPVCGLSFDNVELLITGGSEHMEVEGEKYPDLRREWSKGYPSALYCEYAGDLTFRDIRVCWQDLDTQWKHALWLKNVQEVLVDGFRSKNSQALVAGEVLKVERCTDLRLAQVGYH